MAAPEPSDPELMRLIGQGDRPAFTLFCRRHAGRCLGIAKNLLRNSADAEEVVQDGFLRVWRSAARWQPTEAQVSTWLIRIIVNLCLDQMRRAAPLSVPIEQAADIMATEPSPENLVGHRELIRLVSLAVLDLPPRQRAAVSLVVCEGLDSAEAAAVMQISIGAMESLLVRGRRQIRAALAAAHKERRDGAAATGISDAALVLAAPLGGRI